MTSCTVAPSFAVGSAQACLDRPRLSMMSRLARAFRLGLRRRAAIKALSALDGRLLADIGIDPASLEAETDALLARITEDEG